jgi:hypothetical protein
MDKFYGRFFVFVVIIIVTLALTACGDTERVEPLSVTQNQQIIMQLGVKGFKHLNEVKCYGAVITRVNTGEWYDSYCASAYGHLYFEAIKHG